ncbi:MAG: AAA family ATPase [Gemmatimonadaceae bacterium]
MRIAVSGAHRTGKTTLITELLRVLPRHTAVDEPYHLLAEEGYEFAEMPRLEDFEAQLERSIETIVDASQDQIFDRCPADILAYLVTHNESEWFDLGHWLPRVRSAMTRLDLIVFVPVEHPDRVTVSEQDYADLRRRVDEEIRDIVLGDRWAFGVDTLEVAGTLRERSRQVFERVSFTERAHRQLPNKRGLD